VDDRDVEGTQIVDRTDDTFDVESGVIPISRPSDLDATAIGVPGPGPTRVPAARYTDPGFAELEARDLWPRVWQIACTVDHVSAPGDVFELRCGRLSVLIVRGDDGELRAFQNSCRHRGNSLCEGTATGLTELRCAFHRWTWDLAGRLREVPSRRGFGALRNEDLPLVPVSVGEWGPLVFVNVDPDAEPLGDFLDGVPEDAAWARLDEFRCVVTTVSAVAANWKVVADGFSETNHIQGLHREMLGSIDDVHAHQHLWDRHGASYQRYGVPSPRLGRSVDDQVVWDSFMQTQGGRLGPDHVAGTPMPPVPDGSTIRDVMADILRRHQTQFGADMGDFDTEQMMDLAQYNLFPNATVLVWSEMINVILSRPGPTPDQAEMHTYLLLRHHADAPRQQPAAVSLPADGDLGWILNQDVSVVASMQRGLSQPGFTHLLLSSEERRIANMHRNLERMLGIGPDDPQPTG
jgi:phenylpropionate dioxygenase-like ring-hydroxylating dioxygenase large terminal subunit